MDRIMLYPGQNCALSWVELYHFMDRTDPPPLPSTTTPTSHLCFLGPCQWDQNLNHLKHLDEPELSAELYVSLTPFLRGWRVSLSCLWPVPASSARSDCCNGCSPPTASIETSTTWARWRVGRPAFCTRRARRRRGASRSSTLSSRTTAPPRPPHHRKWRPARTPSPTRLTGGGCRKRRRRSWRGGCRGRRTAACPATGRTARSPGPTRAASRSACRAASGPRTAAQGPPTWRPCSAAALSRNREASFTPTTRSTSRLRRPTTTSATLRLTPAPRTLLPPHPFPPLPHPFPPLPPPAPPRPTSTSIRAAPLFAAEICR